jgi:pimeloyl-ACP methyl ester carboxylesterase
VGAIEEGELRLDGVRGDRDAYLPTRFAEAYAAALPGATLQIVAGGGHWPWIDDPSVIDGILDFVS